MIPNKYFVFLVLMIFASDVVAFSQLPARSFVKTHDRVTINTDVSRGIKSFPAWGNFPSPETDIRKITMRVTLGHPDTMAFAHWDYLDFIYLRRSGRVNGEVKDIEIGRMITPYVSSFKDDWPYDNTITSEFFAPKEMPLTFLVQYKTNNKPEDNHIFLIDSSRDTMYQRLPAQCEPNEVYTDTLRLSPGKFEFFLTDEAGDGLEFWARPQNGYGYLRFIDLDSGILHNFGSDCGSGQFLAFNAVSEPEKDTTVSQNAFFLYPRRTTDNIDLDAFLPYDSKSQVKFLKDGEVFASHQFKSFKQGTIKFDIEHLEPGRYIVEICRR